MLAGPSAGCAEDEAPPGEELGDVVARPEDLALETLPAAHEITNSLFGRRRDPDRDELTGTVQSGQVDRIPPVMLPALTRTNRRERRRYHIAVVAPLGDLTVKYVTSSARFVAAPYLTAPAPAFEEALQLPMIVG